MENKKGLGRGLGSLLGILNDDEPTEIKKSPAGKIEEINGKEVSRSDITDEVRKSGNSYNSRYMKSFEMTQEDELKIYVIAEDNLGYIHKTLAHFWVQSEDGAVAEAVFGGEWIYDKDGNLLYGEKELWG